MDDEEKWREEEGEKAIRGEREGGREREGESQKDIR